MLWRLKPVDDVVDPGVSGELDVHYGAVNAKALIGTFPLGVYPKDVFCLPGLDLRDHKRLIPKSPAVYFLTEGWSVEYVGSTVNLFNRIGHHKTYGMYAKGTWLRWIPMCLEMEPEMRILEFWAIYHLCPVRNSDANPAAIQPGIMNLYDMKIPSSAIGMTPLEWARKMEFITTQTSAKSTTAKNAEN